jgi:predicted nucleic acid-binding protein
MNSERRLVLDANILLSATLGVRVSHLLHAYVDRVNFYSPAICWEDMERHLPAITVRRGSDASLAKLAAEELEHLVVRVGRVDYDSYQTSARVRMARDPSDWPIVATALLLDCPIWTEDHDFFGCGIATWTTTTVELYLRAN